MRTQILGYLLLTILICLITITQVQALTIDSFAGDGDATVVALNGTTTTVTANAEAIGGFRTLFVQKTAGVGGGKVEASTTGSWFYHAQGAGGTKGRSVITWDGNSDGTTVNFSGLGGINLLEDQATGFVIEDLSKDDNTATIRIFVYDATDPSGSKYSFTTINLGKPGISAKDFIPSKAGAPAANEVIESALLFSNFTPGPNGGANFAKVGAIQLTIDGTVDEALDIDFNDFRTNGTCPQSPVVGEKVIDDCGVCRGNNVNKDQCGICFGNNAAVDQCGVCFGNNVNVDNCGICFGNNTSKDQCGICGGNNTTCADCSGMPNGTKVKDICGVCGGNGTSCKDCLGMPFGTAKVDACGVCNGDGKSCLDCVTVNNAPNIAALDAKVEEFIENVRFFLQGVVKSDPKFAKNAKKEIKKIETSLTKSISTLPAKVDSCGNTVLCTKVALNGTVSADIDDLIEKLSIIANKIIDKIKPVGGGKCTRTAKECRKTVNQQKAKVRSFKSLVKSLVKQADQIKDSIPVEQSICTDGSSS